MTNISHNLIGKIDQRTVAILSEIDNIAGELKLPFFVVGATARDILLQHAYDILTARATLDIDIGVSVADWDQFQAMKNELVCTGRFNLTKETQRLMYEEHFPVDIIPFGGIADSDGLISWPPQNDFVMSIMGFQECFKNSMPVLIGAKPELVVNVVSLTGLAVMKLVSWEDGNKRRRKDAADLFMVMRNYIEAGNMDRFFAEDIDILKVEASNYDRSSARFLGREIAKMAAPATVAKLISILKRESDSSQGHKLALDVHGQDIFQKVSIEEIVACFNALLSGLSE